MKKLFIILCLCLATSLAHAQLWVEGQYNYVTYSNGTLDGSKPQEKLMVGWKYFYLWGSMDDQTSINYGGQGGVKIELMGVGAGIRIPLLQYLSCYLEAGYFDPTYDNDWYAFPSPKYESLTIYGNDKVGGTYPAAHYPLAKTEIDGGFGGEAGISFEYPLVWGVSLTAKTGYRYLKLNQHIWSVDTPADAGINGWAFDEQLDMSGIIMGVGLKYEF